MIPEIAKEMRAIKEESIELEKETGNIDPFDPDFRVKVEDAQVKVRKLCGRLVVCMAYWKA